MRQAAILLAAMLAGLSRAHAEDSGAAQPGPAPDAVPAASDAAVPTKVEPARPEPAMPATLLETPSLKADVAAGKLPPIGDRVPKQARVIDLPALGRETGRQGGTWRMLMGDQRDLRMMTVFSYTRLVVFDAKLNIVPDLLQAIDVEGDKVFTLHLRKGHKWSDGKAFTAEDFRYYWEDVANNQRLSRLDRTWPCWPMASHRDSRCWTR